MSCKHIKDWGAKFRPQAFGGQRPAQPQTYNRWLRINFFFPEWWPDLGNWGPEGRKVIQLVEHWYRNIRLFEFVLFVQDCASSRRAQVSASLCLVSSLSISKTRMLQWEHPGFLCLQENSHKGFCSAKKPTLAKVGSPERPLGLKKIK